MNSSENTSQRIPFHVEMNRIIELLARQIYQSPLALLRENCQNAYDAILQRRHMKQEFQPEINVTITPSEIRISDNGIGMTKDELIQHYWRAGSSGKNNPEARAAGVVGTFGIGAMANFGIAEELIVTTESAKNGERTTCNARRETLSATEDCIEMMSEAPTGATGTAVVAKLGLGQAVDVAAAKIYVKDFIQFVQIPVKVNGELVSQQSFEKGVPKPGHAWEHKAQNIALGARVSADIEMAVNKSGEVWLKITHLRYGGKAIQGTLVLVQGQHQIQTFRSRFALATVAVSSSYQFGGIADLLGLEPTAGREALTTGSLQLLQSVVTESERYVSTQLAETELADSNQLFMQWVTKNGQYHLCSHLQIHMEPEDRSLPLEQVKERSQTRIMNYFDGNDRSLIDQYATDESPLIVISARNPRRQCELSYLQKYCKVTRIIDKPHVLTTKPELDWSLAESALALRMISILDTDYFVAVRVLFGKLSHGLPVLVDLEKKPLEIVLDPQSSSISMMLKLYDDDYTSLTGIVKDFVRNAIFPKIADQVPSSTRQGAESFLRAMRRPRDVFEYEKSDLGSLNDIWLDYVEGKISMADAATQSANIVQTTVQEVDRSSSTSMTQVLPDVLENERILGETQKEEEFGPLPAITRLDTESSVKLLTIDESEPALKGYRCFLAITNRAREDRGDIFLQPHRTEIVWGGQKALYIFQHHSGQFGLYYELQSSEILSNAPGGHSFPTCTIVLKNQVYIPIPDEIREKFIPLDANKKRFEIRYDLLYPDPD